MPETIFKVGYTKFPTNTLDVVFSPGPPGPPSIDFEMWETDCGHFSATTHVSLSVDEARKLAKAILAKVGEA